MCSFDESKNTNQFLVYLARNLGKKKIHQGLFRLLVMDFLAN